MSPMPKVTVTQMDVQQQNDGSSCGIFAVAFILELLNGNDPRQCQFFDSENMRNHFSSCLKQRYLSPFPSRPRICNPKSQLPFSFAIYCKCRMPHFTVEDSCIEFQMAQCSVPRCKKWYHRGCVKIPVEVFSDNDAYWECPLCN